MKPSKYFNDLVHDFGLWDMGFNGPDFTWQRAVQHLIRLKSDHRPILLQVGTFISRSSYAPFRYLSGWSSHIDFDRMVADNLSPSSSLSETIISFTKAADIWNKTVYGYIGSKKRVVMARLREVQKALCTKSSLFLVNLESELIMELENILDHEELLWHRKSCSDWIIMGDRNTRYFHRRATCRRQQKRITSLKLPNGEWCSNATILRDEAASYFHNLFASDVQHYGCFPFRGRFLALPSGATDGLDDVPSEPEIHAALMSMAPLKSPA
ncbi:hypothetical protein V6N13_040119 [Hibiscus sabdariffa]